MNHYTFPELKIGMKEEYTVTVDADMIEDFCRITGDVNPLHRDKSFAQSRGYTSNVVYGMLTASFLSTLAGVVSPGRK